MHYTGTVLNYGCFQFVCSNGLALGFISRMKAVSYDNNFVTKSFVPYCLELLFLG